LEDAGITWASPNATIDDWWGEKLRYKMHLDGMNMRARYSYKFNAEGYEMMMKKRCWVICVLGSSYRFKMQGVVSGIVKKRKKSTSAK